MTDELKDLIKKINGLEIMKPEIEVLIKNVKEDSFDNRHDTALERLLFLFNEQWIALNQARYYISDLMVKCAKRKHK